MDNLHKPSLSRRKFLTLSASMLSAGSLLGGCKSAGVGIPHPTASQLAQRQTKDSVLALLSCQSYEEDIFRLLKPLLKDLTLPDLKGKSCLIKPNMVDFHPDKPLTTSPSVLKAAVELADYLGAREIIIGEGPAHIRDTEFLLDTSGVGKLCNKLGLKFVDLNLDDLEKVDNANGFSRVPVLYLPKTVLACDALVSLPKLKTHHWARVTASMKNLFGVVPGRKYGWPKNLLHVKGIDNCILDLTLLLKPAIEMVDAVVAMEGDGPLNGTARQSHFIALGTDPAAVDATCARAMGQDPEHIPYMRVAGQVIGNISESQIKIKGASLASVRQTFELPPSFRIKGIGENQAELQNAIDAGST